MTRYAPDSEQQTGTWLRLLATSDVHAELLDYDYSKDHATQSGSLARLATLIHDARQQAAATLLFDNGDFLQGAAIADPADAHRVGGVNPVIAAMNQMGYDAVGLGNHEFNLEAARLSLALRQAEFPILCANLHLNPAVNAAAYEGLWKPREVLRVDLGVVDGQASSVVVGVFSVLPPQVVDWDKLRLAGRLEAEDMVMTAQREVAALRAAGADVVVALAHTGISTNAQDADGEAVSAQQAENVAGEVAAMAGVDAVICGHIHKVFPGPGFAGRPEVEPEKGAISGTAVVMPGAQGSHLGQIDLHLKQQDGRWRVVAHKTRVIAASADARADSGQPIVAEDASVAAVVQPAHVATMARMRRAIGTVDTPITSYFSMVKDDRAERVVAEAKLAYVAQVVAGTPLADMPLLASVAPLKCGGRAGASHYVDIAQGAVSTRAVADMQPFSNHLSVVQMRGAEVLEWLEKGVSIYNQMRPDAAAQFLFDRDTPTYNREAVYGLAYDVDLAQPARYAADGRRVDAHARRVINATWQGQAVAADHAFLLVTNDYRGGGGGHFPMLGAERVLDLPTARLRDVVADYVSGALPSPPQALPSWRLRALPDVAALFDTSAKAAPYLAATGLPITPVGAVDNGFVRYQLNMAALAD